MQLERFTNPPPTLDLGDYSLRSLRRADAQDWYVYLSDPEVTKLTSYGDGGQSGISPNFRKMWFSTRGNLARL